MKNKQNVIFAIVFMIVIAGIKGVYEYRYHHPSKDLIEGCRDKINYVMLIESGPRYSYHFYSDKYNSYRESIFKTPDEALLACARENNMVITRSEFNNLPYNIRYGIKKNE
jgi:hypothetical protein